jgi:hypothetical protein
MVLLLSNCGMCMMTYETKHKDIKQKCMSGLVTVKYRIEPIILLCYFWSTSSPSLLTSNTIIVDMGVKIGLASPM